MTKDDCNIHEFPIYTECTRDTIFYRTIYSEEIEKSVRFAKKNLQMGGYIYVNYVVIEIV